MANIRIERVNSEIMKAISQIIFEKMNDPRLNNLITIAEVKTSPELTTCKIKVDVLADEEKQKEIIEVLVKSKGFIRHELSQLLNLRITPELTFELNAGMQNSLRIEEILKQLNQKK